MKRITIVFLLITMIISTFYSVFATETAGSFNFDITSTADIENPVGNNVSEEDIMLIDDEEDLNVQNSIYSSDIYSIDEEVELTENVAGNVYIIADKINIENIEIDGNAFLIAKEINIKNTYIAGSSYIVAENVTLNSLMKDLYLIGSVIELGNSSYITRTARIAGETINLAGIIEKNCYVDATSLNISNETMINGELVCTTTDEAIIGKNATIANLETKIREKEETTKTENSILNSKITEIVTSILKPLIIIGVILLLFKNINTKNKGLTISEIVMAVLRGTAFIVIVPLICIIFIASIFGMGIGIILLLAYVILIYISTSVSAFVIAKNIIKDGSKLKILFLSIIVYITYYLITMVPVLGVLVTLVMSMLGIGLTLDMFKQKENKKDEEIIVEKVQE